MTQWIEANWLLVVIALAIAALILLWIIAANRHTRVELSRDEGTVDAPARRNQALIDAAPAAVPSPIPTPSVAPAPLPVPAPTPAPPPSAAEPVATAFDGMAGVEEAILAGATVTPAPPMVADAPLPAADSESELLRIKGLGPKLVDQLQLLGVTRLGQIAAWDDAEIDRIDAQLGRFQGRIRRDDWPTQARLLAADDIAGYEERFGRV